jgi:hypothetical protein
MSRSFFLVGLTVVLCFVAGFLCGTITIKVWKARFVVPVQRKQEWEAYSFFYKTMLELSKGTYNPETDSVSEDVLNEYKKYADRLGGKCQVHLEKDSAGGFIGEVFFPSGDIFEVGVARIGGHLYLNLFLSRNWKQLWMETLDRYGVSPTK